MDTKRCLFTTKAENLDQLRKVDTSFQILPLVYFSLDAWKTDPIACLSSVKDELPPDTNVIVRSSAHGEDSEETSFAGASLSVMSRYKTNPHHHRNHARFTLRFNVSSAPGTHSANAKRHSACGYCLPEHLRLPPTMLNYPNDTHSITDGSSEEHQTYVRWRGSSSLSQNHGFKPLFEAAKLESSSIQ